LIAYACGCVNERHEPTGALRSVSKCPGHTRAYQSPETLGEAYYAEFGLLKNGVFQPTNHVVELTEALGDIPAPDRNGDVLEVGCGVSPYAGVLIERGWHYIGIDPSKWACDWMYRIYDVDMIEVRFENLAANDFHLIDTHFGLILAAHSLEHMDDAPGAIARCAELLAPGGELWLVVPDDTDPVNPDHVWFWSFPSLTRAIQQAGLVVDLMTSRKLIERESFLYCRASKP
jgi:SAM-dependent methyltransferase